MRKCNYPNCRKKATTIIPFGYMGGSDAYCDNHNTVEKRENCFKQEVKR